MQGITRVTHVQGVGRHNLLFEKCNFSSLLIVFINEDKGACAPLSTDVREPQTATGSRMFSFLARFCSSQRTGKALVGRLWFDVTNVMTSKSSKKEKIRLPVTVRRLRTSVLKLPIA